MLLKKLISFSSLCINFTYGCWQYYIWIYVLVHYFLQKTTNPIWESDTVLDIKMVYIRGLLTYIFIPMHGRYQSQIYLNYACTDIWQIQFFQVILLNLLPIYALFKLSFTSHKHQKILMWNEKIIRLLNMVPGAKSAFF